MSEQSSNLSPENRATVRGFTSLASEQLVLELFNVEVGGPYLLALEDAPLDRALISQLREFAIQGKLVYCLVNIPFDNILSSSAIGRIEKASMKSVATKFPGFEDVDVTLKYEGGALFVDIQDDYLEFSFDGFFDEPLNLYDVDAVVRIGFAKGRCLY